MRFVVPLAAAVFLLLPAAGSADNPVLTGEVGLDDAFVISLKDASGAAVTHLDPGTYTLVVHDHSALHNFRLFGPGTSDQVSVATDVDFIGDKTFTITLTAGTYTFNCDPHFTVMKGSFTVGSEPPSPPSTNPQPTAAPPAKLAAGIGPGAKIAVRGTAGLSAGRAVITVRDASSTDNFHLVGPGLNRATGVAFKGTVRWTVTLKPGTYRFRSDRHPKLRGAFTVSS
jgi:hypothetical protein